MRVSAYVYIYRSGDSNVFKIGRATDLERRLRTHATGNPEPLTRFDVIETERASKCETYLHHRLRSKRSRRGDGTEWFEVDPEELAPIIEDARHYAKEVLPRIEEAERLTEEPCDDRILPPSGGVLETYRALIEVREKYDPSGSTGIALKLNSSSASELPQASSAWRTGSRCEDTGSTRTLSRVNSPTSTQPSCERPGLGDSRCSRRGGVSEAAAAPPQSSIASPVPSTK